MTARGDYFPRRVNNWFALAKYAQDVSEDGLNRVRIPTLVALNAVGILAAQSIAVAVDTSTFALAYASGLQSVMGKFGRNVTVVASGVATSVVSIFGADYLGQPMVETLTLNGTTPVVGVKAFRYVTRITAGVTAAITINVGWGNSLGLPYKTQKLDADFVSNVSQAAGTVIQGTAIVQTAITADPRGTYVPNAGFLPDGVRFYDVVLYADVNNLYSAAHFVS